MTAVVNRSVPVALCKPHPQNYNQHDEGQVVDLADSLRQFGQVRSIVVQDDGDGGFLLVAGHGVHAAAALRRLEELRADVIPADWEPVRVLAYLAADNELARRGMPDEAQLAALVQQVEEEAGKELAALAAGGELERMVILAQAELAEALEAMLDEPAGAAATRNLGNGAQSIKPVIYVDDLADFELALRATGLMNRGEAVMLIARHYLESNGIGTEEGQ